MGPQVLMRQNAGTQGLTVQWQFTGGSSHIKLPEPVASQAAAVDRTVLGSAEGKMRVRVRWGNCQCVQWTNKRD